MIRLENRDLRVQVAARGAELRSLQRTDGTEYLWSGDARWWSGISPLLFPVVGRSPGNTIRIGGVSYPMPPHGFAREQHFAVAIADPERLTLTLLANEQTKVFYPFDFRLSLGFELSGLSLRIVARLSNRGPSPMPAQFGFHPGFRWPLPGAQQPMHEIILHNGAEPKVYRLDDNKLLQPAALASPFKAGRLPLRSDLFVADALVLLGGQGEKVSVVSGAHAIDISTINLPHLGIWQKPGAPFICIEPWHGTAPFADAASNLEERNGVFTVPPGGQVGFAMTIEIK